MKVITGKFGGRKLLDNKYEHIRPTADMVKQAVFNKLVDRIIGAKVLDLFCGTGALGIEAISRGAGEVIFVDKDKRSISLTEQNLKNLGIKSRTICQDYESALNLFVGQKFDIILLDPPYKSGFYEKALKLIKDNNLLSDDGIVVCEHNRDITIDFIGYELLDERKYGIKKVSYLRKIIN